MAEEIWKDIEEFKGRYQISNFGNVRTLEREDTCNNQFSKKTFKMKTFKNKSGYIQVPLTVNGKQFNRLVHRLVALAFIPNPENKKEVNHIDENKENNNIDNLEWVTHHENCNKGTRGERISNAIKMRRVNK